MKHAALRVRTDVDVLSNTTITGLVNGAAVEGRVTAHFNTGAGGRSTCEFVKLPPKFNPGTLSTHT